MPTSWPVRQEEIAPDGVQRLDVTASGTSSSAPPGQASASFWSVLVAASAARLTRLASRHSTFNPALESRECRAKASLTLSRRRIPASAPACRDTVEAMTGGSVAHAPPAATPMRIHHTDRGRLLRNVQSHVKWHLKPPMVLATGRSPGSRHYRHLRAAPRLPEVHTRTFGRSPWAERYPREVVGRQTSGTFASHDWVHFGPQSRHQVVADERTGRASAADGGRRHRRSEGTDPATERCCDVAGKRPPARSRRHMRPRRRLQTPVGGVLPSEFGCAESSFEGALEQCAGS